MGKRYLYIFFSSFLITAAAASNEIVFDDTTGFGRTFDGIGGLSGGGATSKLLVNYPEPQRSEILDYLFKPNFGASFHILKVEIGGDIQSTDGTEASHMHNSWDENYERGYEWWLMKEAKKRNANIKLYGLPWGFPGWIGQGTRSPYTNINVTADYIVRWINGAKKFHNLFIDYVGIWNERMYNIEYIKTLRNLLNARGFEKTKIVAADVKWEIADDILKDSVLASDIFAIGCHYPGTISTDQARKTNKQLWASEDYSTFNNEVGGGCWARILNQNYVNGLMTSTISWNIIASYYKGLPFYRDGLMTAVEPWSGHYVVETPIWITAHTTHFSDVGWKYLAHDSGVGMLPKGGSYVAMVSPSGKDLTIIIETMTHNHSICIRPSLPAYSVSPQIIKIVLNGSFAHIAELNVWHSKFGYNGTNTTMFKKKESIKFINGESMLSLALDEVYTLTTIDRTNEGIYPMSPNSSDFPLPYKDDFEAYKEFQEPFYITPQIGSLEVVKSQNVTHGQVIRQTVLQPPLAWCPFTLSFPFAILGSYNWSTVFINIDFNVPDVNGTTGVFVAARVDIGGCQSFAAHGIFLFVFKDQFVLANDLARTKVIKSSPLHIKFSGWHRLGLQVIGQEALGFLDGKLLVTSSLPFEPKTGFCAIGTDTFGLADFDNLYINNHYMQMNEQLSHPLYFKRESN